LKSGARQASTDSSGVVTAHFLSCSVEQRKGQGEDAEPLHLPIGQDTGVVGVFDGLGGAGSSRLSLPEGSQTQARFAARLARSVVERFVLAHGQRPAQQSWDVGQLARMLAGEFAQAARTYDAESSRIRSRMIRTLPTTLALARYHMAPTGMRCEAVWAGDSRVYLLTPAYGLQQLSDDDLRSAGDAMENLTQDSPLSNLVSASADFVLHTRTVVTAVDPVVSLAATDGCFGYLDTPIHFEYMLLECLDRAADLKQWSQNIETAIRAVTGDDASLAMAVLSAKGFAHLRQGFAGRLTELAGQLRWLEQAKYERQLVQSRLAEYDHSVEGLRQSLWGHYRDMYERWLRQVERTAVPPAKNPPSESPDRVRSDQPDTPEGTVTPEVDTAMDGAEESVATPAPDDAVITAQPSTADEPGGGAGKVCAACGTPVKAEETTE
jgi:serine/threonine protein phosphatase PrpC